MHLNVCGARHVSEMVRLGLYIQYGSERGYRRDPKCHVDMVQLSEVQDVRQVLDNVAWSCGRVDYDGDELRIDGFPTTLGLLGCA